MCGSIKIPPRSRCCSSRRPARPTLKLTPACCTGLVIFAGICVNDVWTSLIGLWAVAVAVVTAEQWMLDVVKTKAGLYTFNAHLLGLSIATFTEFDGAGRVAAVLAAVALFAVLTVVISVGLEKAFAGSRLPYLTLPFNIAALWFLGGTSRYAHWNTHAAFVPPPPQPPMILGSLTPGNGTGIGPAALLAAADSSILVNSQVNSQVNSCLRRDAGGDCPANPEEWAVAIVLGSLSGVSQVFFAADWVTGLLVVLGIAAKSRVCALLAFAAALLGVLLGLGLGVSGHGTGTGLEGYDLVLTAIAIGGGVFCQRDRKALVLAAVATGVTFFVHGALQVFLAPIGWPSLTLGFCITTVPILLLREPATARPGSALQFLQPESSSSVVLVPPGQSRPAKRQQIVPSPHPVSARPQPISAQGEATLLVVNL